MCVYYVFVKWGDDAKTEGRSDVKIGTLCNSRRKKRRGPEGTDGRKKRAIVVFLSVSLLVANAPDKGIPVPAGR